MKIVLQVSGREMTFSEEELSAIVEKYLGQKSPAPDIWFEVFPLAINQELFQKKANGTWPEIARNLILEAFEEMKCNPDRYARNFKAMFPGEKVGGVTNGIGTQKKFASEKGDHTANWVEQALIWAQRISNGETWDSLDAPEEEGIRPRLIVWKSGAERYVGGTLCGRPQSHISIHRKLGSTPIHKMSVPLIIAY